jgi:hypothetical protein
MTSKGHGGKREGAGRHPELTKSDRQDVAHRYIGLMQVAHYFQRKGANRSRIIQEVAKKWLISKRMVVSCLDEFGPGIRAANAEYMGQHKRAQKIYKKVLKFPHATPKIAGRTARDYVGRGNADAQRRGISEHDWLWRRSRFLASRKPT